MVRNTKILYHFTIKDLRSSYWRTMDSEVRSPQCTVICHMVSSVDKAWLLRKSFILSFIMQCMCTKDIHKSCFKMSSSYCAPYLDLGVMRWQDKRRQVANSTKAVFGHVLKTSSHWKLNMESDKEHLEVVWFSSWLFSIF